MDFDKKEFYGIVAKAKKQMQITIDQDCNVADTKPDVEKMIQTRGIVKIQETEMMVDRVRIKGEFVFQGLYGTNDTSAYLESLEYSGKNWRAHDRDSGCNAYICIISWRRCPDAGTVCEMGDSGRYATGML